MSKSRAVASTVRAEPRVATVPSPDKPTHVGTSARRLSGGVEWKQQERPHRTARRRVSPFAPGPGQLVQQALHGASHVLVELRHGIAGDGLGSRRRWTNRTTDAEVHSRGPGQVGQRADTQAPGKRQVHGEHVSPGKPGELQPPRNPAAVRQDPKGLLRASVRHGQDGNPGLQRQARVAGVSSELHLPPTSVRPPAVEISPRKDDEVAPHVAEGSQGNLVVGPQHPSSPERLAEGAEGKDPFVGQEVERALQTEVPVPGPSEGPGVGDDRPARVVGHQDNRSGRHVLEAADRHLPRTMRTERQIERLQRALDGPRVVGIGILRPGSRFASREPAQHLALKPLFSHDQTIAAGARTACAAVEMAYCSPPGFPKREGRPCLLA